MALHRNILGVILAGGSARRFFPENLAGGDKGLARLDSQPMLAHVIDRFRPQVEQLILNANGNPARFDGFGLAVVPDIDVDARGPLAGLLAAMNWARKSSPALTSVATVTTDVPFLPRDLVARLASESKGAPAIAFSASRAHPTIGLWPIALEHDVRVALARSELSMNAFARHHGAIAVSFALGETANGTVDPFFNANTREELETARRLLGVRTNN